MPQPKVRIDWDGLGFDTAKATTPIFDRGGGITIRYGRDQARAFSPLAPGRATFEIDDRDGRYDPENDTSPLAADLHPGAPLLITDVRPDTGETVTLLRGYLDDYTVQPDLEQQSVPATSTDALARLRGERISTPLYAGLRTGEAIGLLLDAAGWPADLRDLDRGASVLPWWWEQDADAYEALTRLLDSEGPGSLVTVDGDGAIVFRDRHHRLTRSSSTTVQATFRGRGVEPLISELAYDHGWREIVNAVSFQVQVRAVSGELTVVGQARDTYHVPDGSTVGITVSGSDPFVAAVAPELGVDYTVVSGAVQVWLSRTSGQSTTVYVRAVAGAAVVTAVQVRAYPVTAVTVQVDAEDAASVARHGRKSWPSGREPVHASLWDAQSIAQVILGARAERLPTVRITLRGAGNPVRLVQQLTRDLSDRIRITAGRLDGEFYIEQIEHTKVNAVEHVTVFGCERVVTQPAGVLILDSPTQGLLGTNVLGRTGIDDPATVFTLDSPTQGVLNSNMLLAH